MQNRLHHSRLGFGAAFEPDFLLFLERDFDGSACVVQLFIEPKGSHIAAGDEWKERFLKAIENQAEVPQVAGRTFKVKGLPLFNEADWPAAAAFREAGLGFKAATEPGDRL